MKVPARNLWRALRRRALAVPRRAHRLGRAAVDRAFVLAGHRILRRWPRLVCPKSHAHDAVSAIVDIGALRTFALADLGSRREDVELVKAGVHDLLGSGPTSIRAGAPRPGIEGVRFDDHVPTEMLGRIDWSVDMRSGYRWPLEPWWRMRVGPARGADIKLPWELGRLQHLPRLALHAVTEHDATAAAAVRADLTDFLDANPPGIGVQWACAMDVAIRAVNIVVAWDLLVPDFPVTDALRERVITTMVEHGDHIVRNLEWAPVGRGNHYLCNLVGLLTLGYWLPPTARRSGWFDFAARALVLESRLQFDDEGANVEGSTSYHRLSTEAMIFAALILERARHWGRVPGRIPFRHRVSLGPAGVVPGWTADSPTSALHEVVLKAMAFVRATTLTDGEDVQIGDNDSGRLFHLQPPQKADAGATEAWFRSLVGGALGSPVHPAEALGRAIAEPADRVGAVVEPRHVYSTFGFATLRSASWSVGMRTGTSGWVTHGNHLHDDLLSVVVVADGARFVVDPGSYVYTSLPARREEFRDVSNHSTVQIGNRPQQEHSVEGLFRAAPLSEATIVYQSADRVRCRLTSPWGAVEREVVLTASGLELCDRVETTEEWVIRLVLDPRVKVFAEPSMTRLVRDGVELGLSEGWSCTSGWHSPRYGVRVPTVVLEHRPPDLVYRWSMQRLGAGSLG